MNTTLLMKIVIAILTVLLGSGIALETTKEKRLGHERPAIVQEVPDELQAQE